MAIRNKAPFPYMGSKQRIAGDIWAALGNPALYIEPFFGSGAVLLNRPHKGKRELINDLDGYVCNFWRACVYAPEEVAKWCKGPVHELDLYARNRWLIGNREAFTEKLRSDPRWHDAEVAAWWAWGQSVWIGGGWGQVEKRTKHVVGGYGRKGILNHRHAPLGDTLSALGARLRKADLYCGEWARCLTSGIIRHPGQYSVGVFLDSPYQASADKYAASADDRGSISDDVRAWCIEWGSREFMRVALCGMGDEHRALESLGWSVQSWSKGTTFGGASTRKAERIWYSPHCLTTSQGALFGNDRPGQGRE